MSQPHVYFRAGRFRLNLRIDNADERLTPIGADDIGFS
jgi:tRNA U34 5-carboxymethylaminomethyl modifying enzyme MnmG/GidA